MVGLADECQGLLDTLDGLKVVLPVELFNQFLERASYLHIPIFHVCRHVLALVFRLRFAELLYDIFHYSRRSHELCSEVLLSLVLDYLRVQEVLGYPEAADFIRLAVRNSNGLVGVLKFGHISSLSFQELLVLGLVPERQSHLHGLIEEYYLVMLEL